MCYAITSRKVLGLRNGINPAMTEKKSAAISPGSSSGAVGERPAIQGVRAPRGIVMPCPEPANFFTPRSAPGPGVPDPEETRMPGKYGRVPPDVFKTGLGQKRESPRLPVYCRGNAFTGEGTAVMAADPIRK